MAPSRSVGGDLRRYAWLVAVLVTVASLVGFLYYAPAPSTTTKLKHQLPLSWDHGHPQLEYPPLREQRPNMMEHCYTQFGRFLPSIQEDLLPYTNLGISPELMEHTIRVYSEVLRRGRPGLTFMFKDGKPYVLGNSTITSIPGWFAKEIVIYSHVFEVLSRKYGKLIPDTVFLLMTSDEPEEYIPNLKKDLKHPIFR
jgi:hypothetical protein